MLCMLNLYTDICQLFLNKLERKKKDSGFLRNQDKPWYQLQYKSAQADWWPKRLSFHLKESQQLMEHTNKKSTVGKWSLESLMELPEVSVLTDLGLKLRLIYHGAGSWVFQKWFLSLQHFFFPFLAIPASYGSSQARDQIQAAAVTHGTASVMPNP